MKNTKIMMTILMIWALALIVNLNAATAEEKSMVFEMAESGLLIEFPAAVKVIVVGDEDTIASREGY